MKTITVWVMVRPTEWRVFIFELPAFACDLVQKGLSKLYPSFPHEGYVQLIYEIGGGIPVFFIGCI